MQSTKSVGYISIPDTVNPAIASIAFLIQRLAVQGRAPNTKTIATINKLASSLAQILRPISDNGRYHPDDRDPYQNGDPDAFGPQPLSEDEVLEHRKKRAVLVASIEESTKRKALADASKCGKK